MASFEALLEEDSDNRKLQDGLARAHTNVALVARDEGELDRALSHYDQARQTYLSLTKKAPSDALLADRLALSLANLATVEQARGDLEAALQLYAEAQQIHERWLEGAAATLEHRQHLAEALYMTGALRLASEAWTEAVGSLQRAAELADGLLIHHSRNPDFRGLRAASLHDQAYALWQLDRKDESCRAYQQASAEQRTALELRPAAPLERETLNRYLADQAAVERDTGDLEAALNTCVERQKLWPKEGEELYTVAQDVAVIAAMIPEPDQAKRDQVCDQAIAILAGAVRAGWQDWDRAAADPDLDILRDRPSYAELAKSRQPD
jgi:tetratricopeptide (TPR) repeat protein